MNPQCGFLDEEHGVAGIHGSIPPLVDELPFLGCFFAWLAGHGIGVQEPHGVDECRHDSGNQQPRMYGVVADEPGQHQARRPRPTQQHGRFGGLAPQRQPQGSQAGHCDRRRRRSRDEVGAIHAGAEQPGRQTNAGPQHGGATLATLGAEHHHREDGNICRIVTGGLADGHYSQAKTEHDAWPYGDAGRIPPVMGR